MGHVSEHCPIFWGAEDAERMQEAEERLSVPGQQTAPASIWLEALAAGFRQICGSVRE